MVIFSGSGLSANSGGIWVEEGSNRLLDSFSTQNWANPAAACQQGACAGLLQLTVLLYSFCGVCPGMSMFTTKNGLYERARSKFKIQDGMKLFSYPFYKQRRKDLQVWHPL
jgi:hypothetical protein